MTDESHLDPNSPEGARGAGGDLVERLRWQHEHIEPEVSILIEAADEIERLERVMQAITDACARWGWGHCTTERELIEQIDFTIQRAEATEAAFARAEKERLSAKSCQKAAEAHAAAAERLLAAHTAERDAAKAEVARLREALIWIHDEAQDYTECRERARDIITEKPDDS